MVSMWSPIGSQTEPLPPTAVGGRPDTNVASPRREDGGRWWIAVGIAAVAAVAIVLTAVVTYALTHESNSAPTQSATPKSEDRQFSAAEQAAAKERVCGVFDVGTKGLKEQGGMVNNGEINIPVVVRTMNSVVAVENALNDPTTPVEVSKAAKKYIETSLDLTSGAMAQSSIEEGNRLVAAARTATVAFADVCGLPH